jgi:hypothetical protein
LISFPTRCFFSFSRHELHTHHVGQVVQPAEEDPDRRPPPRRRWCRSRRGARLPSARHHQGQFVGPLHAIQPLTDSHNAQVRMQLSRSGKRGGVRPLSSPHPGPGHATRLKPLPRLCRLKRAVSSPPVHTSSRKRVRSVSTRVSAPSSPASCRKWRSGSLRSSSTRASSPAKRPERRPRLASSSVRASLLSGSTALSGECAEG